MKTVCKHGGIFHRSRKLRDPNLMDTINDQQTIAKDWVEPVVTLWLFNIAMENGPFIDGLPIKNGDFPWLC
jgi:hypothetical protein